MRAGISVTEHLAFLFLLFAVTSLATGPAFAGPAETPPDPAPGAGDAGEIVENATPGECPGRKGCPRCGGGEGRGHGGCGKGRQRGRHGADHESGRGGGGGGRPEAVKAHALLDAREGMERRVEQIPGGVRTTTVTEDPETLALLRSHVRDMEAMVRGDGHIRMWDPLYSELFEHRELIEMSVREIEGGVEVTETSADPWVTELIRAHATKIVEFVYRGWDAYHEPTPLPERPDVAAPVAGEATP
jgi:hypothetical protein